MVAFVSLAAASQQAGGGAILGLLATGLGLQVKGQYEQGKAAERQAKDQAILDEYNAKLAERERQELQEAAAFEESKQRKAGARLKARQRVKAGQAGIDPTDSFALVADETEQELELDALLIRRGGTVGARRLTAEASISRLRGRSALLRGRSARRAGRTRAISTGLRGASTFL